MTRKSWWTRLAVLFLVTGLALAGCRGDGDGSTDGGGSGSGDAIGGDAGRDVPEPPRDGGGGSDGASLDTGRDTGQPDDSEEPLDTTTPDTTAPDGTQPDGGGPDADRPDTQDPDTAGPDAQDDAQDPDTAGPDAQDPDVAGPDAQDDAHGPDTAGPDAQDPDTGAPADVVTPDTGTPDGGGPVEPGTVFCRALPPVASGACSVTVGSGSILLRGHVLAPEGVYEGGEVLVLSNGRIGCVGCDCADATGAAGATIVSCPEGVISPGLINAHDHLTFTQNAPGDWGDERYEHRHDWRKGKNGHTKISVPGSASTAEVTWGELRHLVSGVTAIAGSGGAAGLLRNLDRSTAQREGMGTVTIDYETFPLGDSDGEQLSSGCGYPSLPSASALAVDCYFPHVAEGIDAYARNEFLCLSGAAGGTDITEANSAFVHAVGMLAVDGRELATNGTAVVWSPRSNVSLYGNTAPVTMYHAQGVLIGLGTDWTASGSMNMQRELACAAYLNEFHYGGFFSDRDLWLMATANNAAALAVDDRIGALTAGLFADIAIYRDNGAATPYGAVLEGGVEDTVLVLRGGAPLYGDAALVDALPGGQSGCEQIPGGVCGVAKRVCVQGDTGSTFAQLEAANTSSYDLFFCGAPPDEPSCVPFRTGEYAGPTASDADGDGVADAQDNCPTIFNPIRPLDGLWQGGGAQPDHDQDGEGDVCDPCPMDPDTDQCTPPDPNDSDGDGRGNLEDNCPRDYNPLQEDTDSDEIGDACDACPEEPNPGGGPCPATIYDVKTGAVEVGADVVLTGVVTAVASPRFFLQVLEDEWDADLGATWSGLYVYVPTGNPQAVVIPQVGDLVGVSGRVQEFFGQLQLVNPPAVTVLASGVALPSPVETTPAAAGTGGTDAEALESVLVTVSGEVTALDPPAGPGDSDPTNEYVLDDALRVNDFLWATEPAPRLGDRLEVTGVLRWANDDSKLEPRGPEDIVWLQAAPPRLAAFGPGPVFVPEGAEDAVSVPPLEVTLDRNAPVGGTQVTLTSTDAAVGVPASVTVPEGARTATVPLSGDAPTAEPVVVQATLDGVTLDAEVVVIALGRVPAPIAFEPASLLVVLGVGGQATVRMDIPAPVGGTVVALESSNEDVATVPTTVTVPEGSFDVSFMVTTEGAGDAVITAATAGGSLELPVTVSELPPIGLVLSEVFYNPPSTDTAFEWVELYNGTGAAVDLSGWSLGGGGTDYTYTRFGLAGVIPAGACWVVGGPESTVANFSPVYDVVGDFDPDLQNSGSTADGLALFDVPAEQITAGSVPVDAVIYGSSNTSGLLDETGAAGTPDVGDAGSGRSIERAGDGWRTQATPTPNDCSAVLLAP